jgi:hypothetical protein
MAAEEASLSDVVVPRITREWQACCTTPLAAASSPLASPHQHRLPNITKSECFAVGGKHAASEQPFVVSREEWASCDPIARVAARAFEKTEISREIRDFEWWQAALFRAEKLTGPADREVEF